MVHMHLHVNGRFASFIVFFVNIVRVMVGVLGWLEACGVVELLRKMVKMREREKNQWLRSSASLFSKSSDFSKTARLDLYR
jgi:hypothetical protein